jgi:hypothetical protein
MAVEFTMISCVSIKPDGRYVELKAFSHFVPVPKDLVAITKIGKSRRRANILSF